MSASLWRYVPEICDGDFCPGDCTICTKETYFEESNEESEEEKDDRN